MMGQILASSAAQDDEEYRRWRLKRDADVARRDADEAAGREQYVRSISDDGPIQAGTTSDLRTLGATLRRQGDKAPDVSVDAPAPTVSELVVTGRRPSGGIHVPEPLRAAGSGFIDELSFGTADPILAAGSALLHGGFAGVGDRYHREMETKRADDAYDEQQHGLARNGGRLAGLAASVALMGLPAAERAVVRLLPRGVTAAKGLRVSKYSLDPRGLTTMSAAGGFGAGVASQMVSDNLTGHRGSMGDLAASGLGGGVDGVATRMWGPGAGGAVGGAVTTALRDLLNGRRPTSEKIIDSAHQSAVLGQVGGTLGSYLASRLSSRGKGRLGEFLTDIKTVARGDGVPFGQGKRFTLANGKYTYTDSRFHLDKGLGTFGINEAKLGPEATITPRQIEAMKQLGPNYVLDGWRFSDVGKAAGAALSPYGVQSVGEQEPPLVGW